MEIRLKPISRVCIASAISKAELYRYLNEPGEAESICRDILAVEPSHQTALRLLGLAITDQFTGQISDRYSEAERAFNGLTSEYERGYYNGLLQERKAKAQLKAGRPPHNVLPIFEDAMRLFEEAERVRPPDNDDAVLRWNRCVRLLQSRTGSEWGREIEQFDDSEGPPVLIQPPQ
jgi:tetratricopeptide (TPR) repeat protein